MSFNRKKYLICNRFIRRLIEKKDILMSSVRKVILKKKLIVCSHFYRHRLITMKAWENQTLNKIQDSKADVLSLFSYILVIRDSARRPPLLWISLARDSGHPHDSGPPIFATLVPPFYDRRHLLFFMCLKLYFLYFYPNDDQPPPSHIGC